MVCRPRAVAFDIIGTTFDLEPLRERFVAHGLPADGLELWYAQALRDAFALAATGSYAPFRDVLDQALAGLFRQYGTADASNAIPELMAAMGHLPPQAGAAAALHSLRANGMRLIALSNGAAQFTRGLLDGAGLAQAFDIIVSVDDAACLKPASAVYHFASDQAGCANHELMLVATHPWDVHGAASAGLSSAFVARGKAYPGFMRQPDLVGETLVDVVRQIGALSP